MIFETYAQYYDLFYREKDYHAEVRFILNAGGFTPPMSILDLGCGTGGHVLPLVVNGFQMTGVDVSEEMVRQAERKAKESNIEAAFYLDDIRSLELGKTFDAVISMFAVMGYQTTNEDFYAAMRTARKHLNQGGIFIFDAWYGPGVMHERPETRVKEVLDNDKRVIRIASPELDLLLNMVKVHYTILRLDVNHVVDETHESHQIRFFFAPEVAFFAQQSGFEVQRICPFLDTSRIPNAQDWNVTWVLRAV